jgi:hypothetical protein
MPDLSRPHNVKGLTADELKQARRDLHASLALTRPDSAVRIPILTRLRAIDAELAERGGHGRTSEVTS